MFALLSLVTGVLAAPPEPPEVGITVAPLVAVDIAHDRPDADRFETWTWIRARARQRGDRGTWFLGVDGEHHLRSGADVEALWEARVAESGWSGPVGPVHLRAGILIERWGRLDLLPVTDALNPQDLRAGPLAGMEALRIPVAMTVVQLGEGRVRGELVLIPFAGADRMNLIGTDWSLIRPGMIEGFIAETQTWQGDAGILMKEPLASLAGSLESAEPSVMRSLGNAMSGMGVPEAIAVNGEAALRLEAEGNRIDGALMGGALRSHVPATALDPRLQSILARGSFPDLDELQPLLDSIEEPLSVSWPRTWMAGGEFASLAGPFGLRAEVSWWSDRVVQTQWLGSDTTPMTALGAGVDWTHQTTVFLALESRWTHMFEPPDGLLLARPDTVEVAAIARVSLLAERLDVTTTTLYDTGPGDLMVRPEITWRASDPLALSLGGVILLGGEAPPQSLTEAMTYGGGPLGYWSDNDCIFAQVKWIH